MNDSFNTQQRKQDTRYEQTSKATVRTTVYDIVGEHTILEPGNSHTESSHSAMQTINVHVHAQVNSLSFINYSQSEDLLKLRPPR